MRGHDDLDSYESMFRGDKCVEAGGGIWVREDASDEGRYHMRGTLSCLSPLLIKDILEPVVSRIHGNDEGEERVAQAAYLQSTATHIAFVYTRVPPKRCEGTRG